ncbi:EF-hand domain-containing protein [Pseudoscourfieldia marina]
MDPKDVARKIFAEVDLNDDVVLSADELRAWLECKGEERLSNALFAQLDTDGDGPFVKAHTGTTKSWDVVKEFIAEEDGGGKDTVLTVTSDNIEIYRDKRRAAEKTKSGKPIPLEYRDIPFEQMYTTDIVECFVRRSLANRQRPHELRSGEESSCWRADVLYFISHAWGSIFVDLVKSVTWALAGAAQADTYVWLDTFAINQDDTYGWSVFGDG